MVIVSQSSANPLSGRANKINGRQSVSKRRAHNVRTILTKPLHCRHSLCGKTTYTYTCRTRLNKTQDAYILSVDQQQIKKIAWQLKKSMMNKFSSTASKIWLLSILMFKATNCIYIWYYASVKSATTTVGFCCTLNMSMIVLSEINFKSEIF